MPLQSLKKLCDMVFELLSLLFFLLLFSTITMQLQLLQFEGVCLKISSVPVRHPYSVPAMFEKDVLNDF